MLSVNNKNHYSVDYFEDHTVPPNVFQHILSFLNPNDLINARGTNSSWEKDSWQTYEKIEELKLIKLIENIDENKYPEIVSKLKPLNSSNLFLLNMRKTKHKLASILKNMEATLLLQITPIYLTNA